MEPDAERDTAWLALRNEGWNDSRIARQFGVSRQRVTQVIGPRPKTKGRANEMHVYVRRDLFEQARRVAKGLGYIVQSGPQAGQGSVSAMIEAIGAGTVNATHSVLAADRLARRRRR